MSERSGIDDGRSVTRSAVATMANLANPGCLLVADADHYASTHGDTGWGCGYRNLQLLLSALSRHADYGRALRNSGLLPSTSSSSSSEGLAHPVPSIPRLQELIERAWESGFDPQGKEQVKSVRKCIVFRSL